MTFMKNVRIYVAMLAVAGMAFVLGLAGSGGNSATINVQTVAGELTPGPYGSGVLGDWSTLSHGLYCFNPNGTLQNSYTKAAKKTQALSSASLTCTGEDVRLYGDSITFGGKSAFAAEMGARGLTTYVDAWSGRPTTPVADAICAESNFPPVVVVASGTNDIFNPSVMATQINRIKACIPATTKLFWVDVQATRWGQTDLIERNDQRNSMAINYAIWNNLEKGQIIQWSARFLQQPGLLTTYLVDGVHPKTGTGYAYWAAILRSWLDVLGGI